MASGFIELSEEKDFSIRYTGFDEFIRTIVEHLDGLDQTETVHELKLILLRFIPPKDLKADEECGWGFVDSKQEDIVARIIPLYQLNPKTQDLFWESVQSILRNRNQMKIEDWLVKKLQELEALKSSLK